MNQIQVGQFITLTNVTVNYGGSDYTTPAILLIGGGRSGATAIAHVSNSVIYGIVLTDSGSGYTYAPTVVIIDPNPKANGAIATANYAD